MSRFTGPQPGQKTEATGRGKKGPKGIMRKYRDKLSAQAEGRNEVTDPEDRADWRRENGQLILDRLHAEALKENGV